MKVLIISVSTAMAKRDATYVHTFSLNKELKKYAGTYFVISGSETKKIVFDGNPVLTVDLKTGNYKNKILRLINKTYINFYMLYSVFANINVSSFDIIYERPEPLNFVGMMIAKILRKPMILEVNGILDEEFFYEDGVENKILQKLISKSCYFLLTMQRQRILKLKLRRPK